MKGHAVVKFAFLGLGRSLRRPYSRTDSLPLSGELTAPGWPRNWSGDFVLPHWLEDHADTGLACLVGLHPGEFGARLAIPLALNHGSAG
jgi:hypothetical protein